MLVTVKEPESMVVVRRSVPVASLRTVTFAFGTEDPVASFTNPVMEPKSDWAKAKDETRIKAIPRDSRTRIKLTWLM
jgi:hypothetical protein